MSRSLPPLPALPLLALVIGLAACSRDTTAYPSLAPRPIEKLRFAEPETPPPAAATPDPALDANIAVLTTRLTAASRAFDEAVAKAQAAVGKVGVRTVGSESWLDAQAMLAGLDDVRAQTSGIAAEASDLGAARAQALAPSYPALASLQAATDAETARQEAAAKRLQAAVPSA